MSICLATSNEAVLDLMFTVPIVFCDISGHAITQHMPCCIVNNLQYDIVLGIN